jgi:hypothetical protein
VDGYNLRPWSHSTSELDTYIARGCLWGAEPYSIALSLARNGTYADAFGQGVGPTTPILPIILAIIIRVAGVGLAGYLVQTTLAAIVAAMAFALLPALAVREKRPLAGLCSSVHTAKREGKSSTDGRTGLSASQKEGGTVVDTKPSSKIHSASDTSDVYVLVSLNATMVAINCRSFHNCTCDRGAPIECRII